MNETVKCSLCGETVNIDDACGDLVCRACHKSLTFEECVDGSYIERMRAAAGMPPSSALIAKAVRGDE